MIPPRKKRKTLAENLFIESDLQTMHGDSHSEVTLEDKNLCSPRWILETLSIEHDHFSLLPQEMMLNVISYLGPRSVDLTSIAILNQNLNVLMSALGDTMLRCAKIKFRELLPKMDYKESNLSLFIRHAQVSNDIKMKCNELKRITEKNFVVSSFFGPIVIKKMNTEFEHLEYRGKIEDQVSLEEVDHALTLAVELVAQDSLNHFLSRGKLSISQLNPEIIQSKRIDLIKHCPKIAENYIVALVGYFSSKVYKYIRTRQVVRLGYQMQSVGRENGDEIDDYIPQDIANLSETNNDIYRIHSSKLLMYISLHQVIKQVT